MGAPEAASGVVSPGGSARAGAPVCASARAPEEPATRAEMRPDVGRLRMHSGSDPMRGGSAPAAERGARARSGERKDAAGGVGGGGEAGAGAGRGGAQGANAPGGRAWASGPRAFSAAGRCGWARAADLLVWPLRERRGAPSARRARPQRAPPRALPAPPAPPWRNRVRAPGARCGGGWNRGSASLSIAAGSRHCLSPRCVVRRRERTSAGLIAPGRGDNPRDLPLAAPRALAGAPPAAGEESATLVARAKSPPALGAAKSAPPGARPRRLRRLAAVSSRAGRSRRTGGAASGLRPCWCVSGAVGERVARREARGASAAGRGCYLTVRSLCCGLNFFN